MSVRKHKYGYTLTIIFSLLLGGFIQHAGSAFYRQVEDVVQVYKDRPAGPQAAYVPAMTPANLLIEICKADIKEPVIVYKQAMLETQSLQCSSCSLDVNNLFGFRTESGYLHFQTWVESVAYYKKWQEEKLRDGENYFVFLKRVGFAEDPQYAEKIKSLKL